MKKYFLISLIIIVVQTTLNLFGQKSFMKYGKISEQELTMTQYDNDTSAGAVVLGDFGYTKFLYSDQKGFTLEFYRHVRIKILDKNELDQATFSKLLYVGKGGRKEEITYLKAFTYNYEDGKEVKSKIEKSAIFEEMADKNYQRVKFSLPNVKVGSILEVSYKIESPYLFNLTSWQFQRTIPTIRSEYHVYVPEYFNYKNWVTGYIQIQKNTDTRTEKFSYRVDAEITPGTGGGRTPGSTEEFEARVEEWSYVAENVPAFIPEPKITTLSDYLSFVQFELVSIKYPRSVAKYYTTTWEKINEEMMDDEDFGKQLKRSGQFKDLIEKINSSTTDNLSKMIMAYESLKNKLVWDGRYRLFPSSGIAKAYKEGGGSSADINLNLVALLRELDITANPVLISTRSNGMLRPGQVILSQFNHVIVAVKISDQQYLLDATDPYCPYFMLPPNSLNDKGMMLSETGYKWVDLYSKLQSVNSYYGKFKINSDFEFEGNFTNTCENFAALYARKEYKEKTNIDEYKKDIETELGDVEISNLNVENIDSLYKPVKIAMDISFGDRATEGADMLYFKPILFERLNENPFKKESREYPVDYNFPFRTKHTYSIDIPEGYQVVELPKSAKVLLPDDGGKFTFIAGCIGKTITISCDMQINQTIFPSLSYQELKKFYEIIVAKMAEQVVLKKEG